MKKITDFEEIANIPVGSEVLLFDYTIDGRDAHYGVLRKNYCNSNIRYLELEGTIQVSDQTFDIGKLAEENNFSELEEKLTRLRTNGHNKNGFNIPLTRSLFKHHHDGVIYYK